MSDAPRPGAPCVEINGVSFGYPGRGRCLVDISFSLCQGEICCLLGPNGAGKTTLLRCLLNLLSPSHGTIRVHGHRIAALSARELARLVAYVPQRASTPFAFTAADVAVMGRTPHLPLYATPSALDRRMAQDRLDELGIGHLRDRRFSELSGGERQLVLIARALVQQAPVLVLDEPTAALDFGNEIRLLGVVAALAREGRSIVMTTHQPAHALSHSNRAILMRRGVITADGPPGTTITSERLTALYEAPIHVATVDAPDGHGGTEKLRACIALPPGVVGP